MADPKRLFGHSGSVDDIRELARRRLPHGLFEFIDRGSDDELAISNNREAFDQIKFRPHVLADVSGRTSVTQVLGSQLAMPVVVAPTGSAGIVWHNGEAELARAARQAGVPFTLAMRSMASVEEIAEIGGDLWFQLYPMRDRELTDHITDRVRDAGFNTLVITADTPTLPSRDYNDRNGYSIPFKYSTRAVVDMLRHPRWLASVIGKYLWQGGLPRFENLPGSPSINDAIPASAMLCDDLTWNDVERIRKRWPGKLVIKGILHEADAQRATQTGADAVIVSNHGGRNLDSSIAPIDALPSIVDAISGKLEILVDGGVRRGSDIAKALALGANSVLIGRPTLYGTAVAGEDGAAHVLARLKKEFLYILATLGARSPNELSPEILTYSRPRMTGPRHQREEGS